MRIPLGSGQLGSGPIGPGSGYSVMPIFTTCMQTNAKFTSGSPQLKIFSYGYVQDSFWSAKKRNSVKRTTDSANNFDNDKKRLLTDSDNGS